MQINVEALKKYAKWLEYTYVVILLTALTQGPVFKLWLGTLQSRGGDGALFYQTTFLLVQLPALFILGQRIKLIDSTAVPVLFLGGFCLWMTLSSFWSVVPSETVTQALALALTAASGLYIAASFTRIQQIYLVGIGMQPGLVMSFLAVKRNWESSISDGGEWAGIYFNSNSLAPVAAVGLLAVFAVAYLVTRSNLGNWSWALLIFLADVGIFDGYLLIRTGSSVAIGAIVVFFAAWGFWSAIRYLRRRRSINDFVVGNSSYISFIAAVGVAAFAVLWFQEPLLRALGEEALFNGRTEIWQYGWTGFLDRPIFGWGWMSAWKSELFTRRNLWWSVEGEKYSHNAFIDIFLGGGVIGLLFFLGFILWGCYLRVKATLFAVAGQWTLSIVLFVLVSATQEDFVIGNHFLWLLLVASICGLNTSEMDIDDSVVIAPQEETA